jgi:[ribosomal protein S18]-alanine N-acetyltransferase
MSKPSAHLRPARPADLDAILALDRATDLAPHWPAATYAAILNPPRPTSGPSPQRCLIVAERVPTDETTQPTPLAGFAVSLLHPPAGLGPRIAELEDIVVAANCRRTGIGRALCTAVLDWCRTQGATEVALEVRAANPAAIALYTRLGFQQVGRRPRYYLDPEDEAIAMLLRWNSVAP